MTIIESQNLFAALSLKFLKKYVQISDVSKQELGTDIDQMQSQEDQDTDKKKVPWTSPGLPKLVATVWRLLSEHTEMAKKCAALQDVSISMFSTLLILCCRR